MASDLAGLVRFAAPLARLEAGVTGVCELAVRAAGVIEPSMALDVRDGVLGILSRSQRPAVDARAEAQPMAWCKALVSGRSSGLRVSGSAALVDEIVRALHGALSIDWPER